jgi:diguanylate cyclase (GGDEF)-like protein/PAS domain S-box-containing protein
MNLSLGFLEQILDNLSEGVYIVDAGREITFWSLGAEAITGHTAGEVEGRHCHHRILRHMDSRGHSMCRQGCPLTRAMRTGKTCHTRAFLRHRDGHRIPVTVATIPIRNARGTISGAIEIFSSQASRQALTAQIRQLRTLALVDPLTGVTNRRYLEMTLQGKLDEARRYRWHTGLIFADIDNFKSINDSLGHATGDKVLAMVAGNLLSNSRSFDTIGRWGGDEFMVICGHVTAALLTRIADRYRMLIRTSSLAVKHGHLHITISAGATLIRPSDTMESLLERADKLLYQGKRRGKDQIAVF